MTTTVQNYLDKGLRGLWYPVLASWEVQSAPVGITRLGEQIVVWRNNDGQVQALEDRCPHRGARLSMGWNLGDRIACWYHGVEVAGPLRRVFLSLGFICMINASFTCHSYDR